MIRFPSRSVSAILPVAQVLPLLMLIMGCGAPDVGAAPGGGLSLQSRDISGDDPVSYTTEPLIVAPPKRTRTIAALRLDLGPGAPDLAKVTAAMESVRQMYVEESYGMQDLAIDVVGPWKLPVGQCLTLACCGPSSDRTGNGATVMSAISSLGKTYDHYLYIYGTEPAGSNCGTWGDTGNPTSPAKYCSIEPMYLTRVDGIEQELGHNLGMQHEHTMSCSGGTIFPDDPSSCSNNEYGSKISYMGDGPGHASAYHKVHQGWLSGCNVVKAAGPGSYSLLPLELPCDGTQVLQIPAAKTRNAPGGKIGFFYAELRTPIGKDKSTPTKPSVILYAGPDFPSARSYGGNTYLLTQLTAAGQSFTDPSGSPKLTVDSIGMTGATITITGGSGAPTCLDGSAFTPPGRDISSCAAAPASVPGMGGSSGTGGVGAGAGGSAAGGRGGGTGGSGGGAGGATSGSGGSGTGGRSSGGAGSGMVGGSGGSSGMVGSGGRANGTGGASTGGATTIGTGGTGVVGSGGGGTPATGGGPGIGGTGQTGGAAGGKDPGANAVGGCACDATTDGGSRTSNAALMLLLAFGATATRLRRKRITARRRG